MPSPLKVLGLCVAAIAALVLSSCNTVSGFGRDLENAGTSLENAANR